MAKKKISIQTIDKPLDTDINKLTCAFCGRKFTDEDNNNSGVNFLISPIHKDLGICDVCLDTCYETNALLRRGDFEGEETNDDAFGNVDIGELEDYTPEIVKAKLDEYVIGQESAKRALSIAAYNHMKRIKYMKEDLEKVNVMLVGPTGSGKTFLVDTLSQILKVPFISINITEYSQTGYKGKDTIDILKQLYDKTNGDISLAERSIIFIDEVDKIANSGEGSQVGDGKVQQSLLKMIEGCEVSLTDLEAFEPITINTKNILFIFAGAFVGIEKFQKGNETSLGFMGSPTNSKTRVMKKVLPKDLTAYGMLPEFIGRIQKIVTLKELDKDDLIRIMKQSKKSSCVQFAKSFKLDGYNLIFEDDALEEIADECIKAKLGARALKNVIEDTMEELEFSIPSKRITKGKKKKIVVTKEMVKNRKNKDLTVD